MHVRACVCIHTHHRTCSPQLCVSVLGGPGRGVRRGVRPQPRSTGSVRGALLVEHSSVTAEAPASINTPSPPPPRRWVSPASEWRRAEELQLPPMANASCCSLLINRPGSGRLVWKPNVPNAAWVTQDNSSSSPGGRQRYDGQGGNTLAEPQIRR